MPCPKCGGNLPSDTTAHTTRDCYCEATQPIRIAAIEVLIPFLPTYPSDTIEAAYHNGVIAGRVAAEQEIAEAVAAERQKAEAEIVERMKLVVNAERLAAQYSETTTKMGKTTRTVADARATAIQAMIATIQSGEYRKVKP